MPQTTVASVQRLQTFSQRDRGSCFLKDFVQQVDSERQAIRLRFKRSRQDGTQAIADSSTQMSKKDLLIMSEYCWECLLRMDNRKLMEFIYLSTVNDVTSNVLAWVRVSYSTRAIEIGKMDR